MEASGRGEPLPYGAGENNKRAAKAAPQNTYTSFSFCAAFSPLYKEKKRQRKVIAANDLAPHTGAAWPSHSISSAKT